ncbi:2-oxoacid:ferredoxin oxidoreductase subunit beta [Biformimicrobium ophioploci]|uniref:2-oxoacid:ferredoxin oxidoreductase subunit beta n=1 Tax=Biformimicrobium ophioploci TaxID=3036711 RepID=A0ABQ6LY50_9GAMM|nr:2-oxoacid:ferredoxin oxidoreductase subunit beta [Microbulbifer sp. NKW57]GMG87029.1 2-oxoacid:ferredoxin oxidoreductase subunit beta [Microbulbifer sp. NKW57]
MSYLKPGFSHPHHQQNNLGLYRKDYEGALSTLCAGCGHDSVSAAIVQACFEADVEPHRVAKLSGIGCSSKTPNYFLNHAHGFNSVHGRMPSVATGACMANRELIYVGVSGDGDTASIGMGQFAHVARRNLNMVYLVENNGCYGLTKGQDSATTDMGSVSKAGRASPFESIDLVALALQLGATYVARGFSGDKEQLVPLIRGALAHRGFAFIDIISPCVTFNNNPGSTKGYEYVREHMQAVGQADFIPVREEVTASYEPGCSVEVALHDGSVCLNKIDPELDISDRASALRLLDSYKERGEILTGLLHVDRDSEDLHDTLETADRPLRDLSEQDLCPGQVALDSINQSCR